jgi:hypothetical protein
MLLFIWGSAHSAFLQAGPRAFLRAHYRNRGALRPDRGRDATRRSEPGPTPPSRRVASPPPDPPPSLLSPVAPLKGSHRPPADFFSLARRSSRPSTPERRTLFPHRPGIDLTGYPPPEPLLRAGLRLSVTVVRPLPVSALRAAPFLNRPLPPHPPGLPRAAGALHTRR